MPRIITSCKIALLLAFAAQGTGCIVLVPFVEADPQSQAVARAANPSSYQTRRGVYKSPKYALAATPDQKVQRLMRQMKSPEVIDRIYAAYDLGELGPKAAPAVPVLVDGLQDSTKYVRRASVKALAKIGAPACGSLPAMRRSIGDKDRFVGASAENAVRKLQRSCSRTPDKNQRS